MSKRVTVYNTSGSNEKVVTTIARFWDELQRDLSRNGIPYESMTAVVGETQVTLQSAKAELPSGDFTLFLSPTKVKSGYDETGWEEYDEEEDEDYIDEESGEDWDDYDWTDPSVVPEECELKSAKDLAIARMKKAQHYFTQAMSYLIANPTDESSTNKSELAAKALEIRKNMEAAGVFN